MTRKIKRSKQSHSYYPNSVATDRLVLAGDEKSVQNIAVKKSCVTCNKTIRLNQKELTCNLCSGSFHYKCEAGKLKLDVNLWNCTRCELPPLSDSFFDSDTELSTSIKIEVLREAANMTNSKTTISTLWTGTNRT